MYTWSFPITINEDSHLHYYLQSDSLFGVPLKPYGDHENFDTHGVPYTNYKWVGRQVNPFFITWWGLANLRRGRIETFDKSIDWLHRHARERKGARVWEYDFDWVEGYAILEAPWISAISQGLAISALIRSWRRYGRHHDLELAESAAEIFWEDIRKGGLLDVSEIGIFLEEYPAKPFPRVLDGFCFALLALHDLSLEIEKPNKYDVLLNRCLNTIENFLPFWDFNGWWSWYGREGFLCDIQYHTLNRVMLEILYRISGRKRLLEYARKWDPARLTPYAKLIVRCSAFATLAFRRRQYNKIRRTFYH